MKIKALLSALLIGFLVISTSHVTFALDTGPDKVPKKECSSVNADVVSFNYDYDFVNANSHFLDVEVEATSFVYNEDVTIESNHSTSTLIDLPRKVGWYRTTTLIVYNIPSSTTINQITTAAINHNKGHLLWIDKIKQCILRSECSSTTV